MPLRTRCYLNECSMGVFLVKFKVYARFGKIA